MCEHYNMGMLHEPTDSKLGEMPDQTVHVDGFRNNEENWSQKISHSYSTFYHFLMLKTIFDH